MTPEEHNERAVKIADDIIRPTLEAGGNFLSILVLLESVITGVLLFGVKDGGDRPVLDLLFKHVLKRLAAARRKRKNN
jgi:hypothetical protein